MCSFHGFPPSCESTGVDPGGSHVGFCTPNNSEAIEWMSPVKKYACTWKLVLGI